MTQSSAAYSGMRRVRNPPNGWLVLAGLDVAAVACAQTPKLGIGLSVVRDFETGGGLNQERVWRIMVDVTRLVCGEATDGFGWSCV